MNGGGGTHFADLVDLAALARDVILFGLYCSETAVWQRETVLLNQLNVS